MQPATDTSELEEFLEFATELQNAGERISLDEATRRFREQHRSPAQTRVVLALDELRARYIAEGGVLLTPDEVADEIRERRGTQFVEESTL